MVAIFCVAGSMCAQESRGGPDAQPVILGQKEAARRVLMNPKPEYPAVAKVNYLQGRVQLKVTVNGQGKVISAHVVQGNAVLAASALKAVRRWIYRPLATPRGSAGFITFVRLNFSLTSGPADLTPQRAEQDFLRQVKPPRVLRPPEHTRSGDVVRLRLLVSDQGKVEDMEMSPPDGPQTEVPGEALRGWSFLPAHWGNVPIASYVDVDVPAGLQSIARAGSAPPAR